MRRKSKKSFKPKFRSGLEKTFAALYPKEDFDYEPYDVPYITKRKGAKLTMAQWCDKEGFKYFTVQQKDELMNYVTNNE